ncbi:MAG: hypothetical protein WDN01_11015 [Rhizomicrobium sp.]
MTDESAVLNLKHGREVSPGWPASRAMTIAFDAAANAERFREIFFPQQNIVRRTAPKKLIHAANPNSPRPPRLRVNPSSDNRL